MDASGNIKLLSVLEMPQPVAELFRKHTELVVGTLDEAHRLKPDALLCSIGPARLDAAAIAALPRSIRAIATYSVGFDHIDLQAAAAQGIAVFNTPGVLADAVADAALLLILGAARRATESIDLLRTGRWKGWSPRPPTGICRSGRTTGSLGPGETG